MINTLKGFYYLDYIKLNKLHKKYGKGEGKSVLVIDSGINLVKGLENVVSLPKLSPGDAPGDDSQAGHGTLVTSVIKLIAPDALLHVLDVEVTNLSYDLQGYEWAAKNYDKYKWDVINISRVSGSTHEYKEPLSYLNRKGAVICACTGNQGFPQPEYPAYWAKANMLIAVGACDKKGRKLSWSNSGEDILLPGIDIKCLWKNPPPKWTRAQGTSLASPIAAGMIACWSTGANTVTEAKEFLKEWMGK